MGLIMVDLDGTLFDTKRVNYMAYQEAMQSYGFSIDYEYYCKYCNGRHYLDFLPQISTSDMDILAAIHDKKKAVYSKYLSEARVNQPLLDMLLTLKKKYKVALVTTASRCNTTDILSMFNVLELFDLIITHEDVEKRKPDPEGYVKAMYYFSESPKECIIFEDSEVGIEAAIKSGA